MTGFIYPIQLHGRTVYAKEYTQQHHKILTKTLLNNDIKCFEYFIDNLLADLIVDSDITDLNKLDKLLIFLHIRCFNINPIVQLEINDKDGKGKVKTKISVQDIIDDLLAIEYDRELVIDDNEMVATFTMPRVVGIQSQEDIYSSSLKNITLNGKLLDCIELSTKERYDIFNRLPSTMLSKIVEYIAKVENKFKDKVLFKLPKEMYEPEQIIYTFMGDGFFNIMNFILSCNLNDFYTTEYTLIKHCNFSKDQINEYTPGEIQIIFNLLKRDMETERKNAKSQESQGIPMPQKFS